jgi:hypothetical protein
MNTKRIKIKTNNLLVSFRKKFQGILHKSKTKLKTSLKDGISRTFNFRFLEKNSIKEEPNLKYIRELSNSDINFQNEFIKTFSDEYSAELQAYLFCIQLGATRAAAVKVGKLKDKFNILGMKKAFKLATRHQLKLQRGNKSSDGKFKEILAQGHDFLKNDLHGYQLSN